MRTLCFAFGFVICANLGLMELSTIDEVYNALIVWAVLWAIMDAAWYIISIMRNSPREAKG